jgi:hypothetical protein
LISFHFGNWHEGKLMRIDMEVLTQACSVLLHDSAWAKPATAKMIAITTFMTLSRLA